MISICWTHKQDNKRYVLTTAYPDTVLNAEQRDPCTLQHMFKLKPLNQNWQFNNPLLYVYKYLLNVRRKVKGVLSRNCRKYAGHWTTGTKGMFKWIKFWSCWSKELYLLQDPMQCILVFLKCWTSFDYIWNVICVPWSILKFHKVMFLIDPHLWV